MNSLKSHIALIIALISILLSIFLFKVFNSILHLYQQNILNNYSIIIVSQKQITHFDNKAIIKIDRVNISKQLNAMKRKFTNIDFSRIKMPYFYKLHLKSLPSPSQLKYLEGYLKSFPYIKRVLTYSSSQTKIYNLLTLLKITSKFFMIIIAVLGFMLIIKQLEVWKFEHNERMYIMELFGAPFWLRGAALFKIALTDSFIALFITAGIMYYIVNSALFNAILKDLSINPQIDFLYQLGILAVVSFAISFVSSILVISGSKK